MGIGPHHHHDSLCCPLTDSHSEQMSHHGLWHSHFLPCIVVQWEALCTGGPHVEQTTSTSLYLIIDDSTGWCVRLASTVLTLGYWKVSATEVGNTGEQPRESSMLGKMKKRSFVLVHVFIIIIVTVIDLLYINKQQYFKKQWIMAKKLV